MGVAISAARPASAATPCTLPSECFSVGQVCHLGFCAPCESNFDDGGLSDPLFGCQDPSHPICDIPDGSVGGACVQCTKSSQCPSGETCNLGTNTCSGSDGGSGDGGNGDGGGTNADGGGTNADGGGTNADGGGTNADGGGSNADGGGSFGDGGGTPGEGGAIPDDGSFVEGGGCSCDAAGAEASFGGAALSLLVGLAMMVRRAQRRPR